MITDSHFKRTRLSLEEPIGGVKRRLVVATGLLRTRVLALSGGRTLQGQQGVHGYRVEANRLPRLGFPRELAAESC